METIDNSIQEAKSLVSDILCKAVDKARNTEVSLGIAMVAHAVAATLSRFRSVEASKFTLINSKTGEKSSLMDSLLDIMNKLNKIEDGDVEGVRDLMIEITCLFEMIENKAVSTLERLAKEEQSKN